jgi:hypothetical protein
MKIDWWTLGLQAVNALVLIWLLAHFLFRPVVDAIAARQKAAGELLADAKAAKAAAESERERAAAETIRLAEHRSEALQAAEAEAAAAKSALLATAQPRQTSFGPLPQPRSKPYAAPKRSPPRIARDGLQSILPVSSSTDCLAKRASPLSSMESRPAWQNSRREPGHLLERMARRST